LDAAVDSLISDVKGILGKPVLEVDDAVIVDGRVEISCTTFNDLREGRWLDNWMLMAGIQMSDKPHFIRYGDCIPLDEPSRRGLRPIRKPLDRWRKTIEAARMEHGQNILVFVCPLHRDGNHFSLLEINDREKKIYHFDSKAYPGVIDGQVQQTRVGKIVQVSIAS
jgi:hypothetical protein